MPLINIYSDLEPQYRVPLTPPCGFVDVCIPDSRCQEKLNICAYIVQVGIPKLLDPEDIFVGEPEEKSIITYLVSFYHYFAREKVNTVHARRIERVINLLKHFINEVKDYELSADKLLKWIQESIQYLDIAALQGNLEGLQHQLVEFNRFRTEEKPPHFYEKGELEMAFFFTRNEMLAVGMRAYVPPKELQISEVNKAWQALEHCEYEHWLDLNDELRRQEMLDQLFLKFETKCALRESWLLENQHIAEQELVGSSRHALFVALKKHEAFEADVFAYEDRIEMLLKIANELKRFHYYREDIVSSRSQEVTNRWLFLLDTIKIRRSLIKEKICSVERNMEFDDLMKFAAELKDRIDRIDPGSTFEQTQHALMNIEAIDNEIKTLCVQVDNLLKKNHDSHCEELEKEWADVEDRIVLSAAEKRREINLLDQQWHLLPDISRYRNYIESGMRFVEAMEFQFTYKVVNQIQRQVSYIEEEIADEQNHINLIVELAAGSKCKQDVNEFIASWELLNKILRFVKAKAVFVGDVLLLKGEIEDSESWIAEKEKILEFEGVRSLDLSVRLNQKLLEEVEPYLHAIENINEKTLSLKEECKEFDYFPKEFAEIFNSDRLVRSFSKVRSEIERILTEKTENLFQIYVILVEKIRRKQGALIDALSVEQFLNNSNQAHSWIIEKSSLLDHLKPTDLDVIYEEGVSVEMREQFDFIERRFNEIECQMSEMADKVTSINKTATNIVDALRSGKIEDSETSLSKVTEARNKLNVAWNQLADRVENIRDRLNLDHAFLELSQDCFFTVEWIDEKLANLNRHDWTHILTFMDLSRLNMALKSLKSDAKVIHAKVEDISEQITACYQASDSSTNTKRNWLIKEHEALCGKLAEFDQQLEQCDNLVTLHGSHRQSAQSLENFLQWVTYLKDKDSCITISSNIEEVRSSMSAQEGDLQELLNAEKHLEKLLSEYEKLAPSEDAGRAGEMEIHVDPDQVIEEYATACDLVRNNIANLSQNIAIQDLFAELGSLEAAVGQQDVYVNQQIQQESLEAVEAAIKEHEAFIAALLSCCNRYSTLDRKARELLGSFRGSEGRFIAKLNSLREKLEQNKEKAYARERFLKENQRLYEVLNDFADIEDWMGEKSLALNQVTMTSKRDVSSAYAQVKALQEEIEASRERADGIIQSGKELIEQCSRVDHVVSARIDDTYVNWESLLQQLHSQMLSLEESHREHLLNETVQDLLRWAERLLTKIKMDIEDPTLTTAGLTELQRRFETHQRDCRDFENCTEGAAVIKEHTEALSQYFPDRAADFASVNTEVEKHLEKVDLSLEKREQLLNLHTSIASNLLDLNSELFWVKDKLVQIRKPYDDWTPKDRSAVGKQLLRVQQEKLRLINHITEVENRGPRVKNLCLRVKETYLSAEANAGARLSSFRDVLGELEQAWYTVTHLLEVRREELRLAEMIHKFSFDTFDLEAWISERELYLQSISEPTNIEEANRALRRLNVLNEVVNKWSNEVTRIKRRANELSSQLSSGVQINGNWVAAPPITKSAVANAANRLTDDFSHLEGFVAERRKDLLEAISLHDLMQDVNDLEDWIAKHQKNANNPDVGTDLEHTFSLHDRFDHYAKCTRTEGERRMQSMLQRMDQMILRGHRNRSEIALAKDGLNDDWADLLEMLITRSQLLKSALTLQRFFYDTQYLEKQIEECYQYVPAEPTVEMVTGQSGGDDHEGIANLRRKEAGLALRLTLINTKCRALSETAGALLPAYGGDAEVRLRVRHDCVICAAQKLAATAETRARSLAEAVRLHSFFINAQNLLDWLAEAKDRMSQPNGLSRTIHDVERLIGEHRQLYAELGIKVKQIEECLDAGRSILGISESSVPAPAEPSQLWLVLTAPCGEVREVCVSLATERILAEAMWRERWERLTLLLDARCFLRDASAAESWLGAREVYLVSVRRNIGETLADTLALLGAHYAFERACASADERFAALKRLTKMEIHALEWKPEDARRDEKQKRDNIRRAVHEFLPPPTESLYRLTPHIPPSMPSRGPRDIPKDSGVVKPISQGPPQALRASLSPQRSFEGASTLAQTVPLPQKHIPRASQPTVSVDEATLSDRAVGEEEKEEISSQARTRSSSSSRAIFFPRKAKVTPHKSSIEEPATSATPVEEGEEGKTLETTSSTRPQGSFPSTSGHTTPPERRVEGSKREATQLPTTEELPRVEGPLIRKWESDAGGTRHSRGRGWTSTYVTLMEGKMAFYKDRRTRREQESELLNGEEPLDLAGAVAVPAVDYTKRPFVFRLRLFSGAEYLFQAVSSEVLQRWVDAINESASMITPRGFVGAHERAHSLIAGHHSRASSAASGQEKRHHSSLRRIIKRP